MASLTLLPLLSIMACGAENIRSAPHVSAQASIAPNSVRLLAATPTAPNTEFTVVVPALAADQEQPEATPTATTLLAQDLASSHQLNADEMRALLAAAEVPAELQDAMMTIAWCESQYMPWKQGDGGASRGLFQLWTGWFPHFGIPLDGWDNPLTNARVALFVRQERGRFGGAGGWSCADLNGIP